MRVKGNGPLDSGIVFVGEVSGREEENTGKCFIGKPGKEMNRILERCGLSRSDIYTTYLVKERPPWVDGKQKPPSKEDIERDEHKLIEELLHTKPSWIGTIGRVATRWFLGDDVDLESTWGMAYEIGERIQGLLRGEIESRLFSGGENSGNNAQHGWISDCRIIPLYHPSAGLHNADLSSFVWEGIRIFSDYVHGAVYPVTPVDRFRHPSYADDVSASQVLREVAVACDTEGLPGRVWGGSVSSTAGTALVCRLSGSRHLREILDDAPTVVFHHSLHDVPILAEIGIPTNWTKVEDTMLMAYCLRLVPQGLKQLARRFCGMKMQSYMDVVAPAERKLALEYVDRALAANSCPLCEGSGKLREERKDGKGWKKQPIKCWYEDESGKRCIDGGLWVARDEQLKYDWDTGEWKVTKGWSVGRYLNNLRKDMQAGKYEETDSETGETLSVRSRVNNWPDDVLNTINKEVGYMAFPTLDDIPAEDATFYSARDADATIRIYPILSERIDALGLRDAYELDLSVIPVAAEMQKNGMFIDPQYFAGFVKELENDNQIILERLQTRVGRPINPASGDQVAGLLFGERGLVFSPEDVRTFTSTSFDLEPEKYTKSGKRGSTNDKTLEGLKLKHSDNKDLVSMIDLILDYRMRDKILGTYARKLPLMVDRGGRIHTTIKPTRTATFRWSSANPNLQNIPVKPKNGVDLGKMVRRGFIAPPGYVLGSWDFDQIEMRVLAWYSQDANLLRVFREGIDIHAMTAALIWRVPFDQFMAELKGSNKELASLRAGQRLSGKNIGFGVVYGVTAKGLKAQMDLRGQVWTEEECQNLIDMYLYEAYPGIGRFMMEAHAEARRNGYVRSLFGHIRYMPGVHSSIGSVREEALRQAANFKIQCHPGSTRIRTINGFERIGDFEVGTVWTGERWASATRIDRGHSSLLEVETHDRAVIKCTPDHKFSVLRTAWPEWVTAQDLKIQDILLTSQAPVDGDTGGLTIEDVEFWYWVGRYYGDGNLFDYRRGSRNVRKYVCWAFGAGVKDTEVDQLVKYLESRNWYASINKQQRIKQNGEPTFTYQVSNRQMDKLMVKYGITPNQIAPTKRLADVVFKLDRKRREAVFQGYYDADGTRNRVSAKGTQLAQQLTSVNLDLLRDTQLLLRSLDISSVILGPYLNKNPIHRPFYRLTVRPVLEPRRVKEVRVLDGVEEVFTLSVDDERHSYDSEGLISKNCTAAELLKVAMRTLWYEYKPVLDEVGSKLLMAVHDELLLEVLDTPDAKTITDTVVTLAMTNPVLLEGVSVGTTGKYDYSWDKLK